MPRVDFQLWDRVYILKLICTAQATYSSFVVLIYIYLIILQGWTTAEDDRSDIMKFKWSVIVAGVLEFGLGIFLAFAANMTGIRCKLRIMIWIVSETFLIPTSIFLLMQLQKRLNNSKKYETDVHYSRVNIGLIPAQVCFLLIQYLFIAYAIDFLVQGQQKAKTYDPSIRPKSVYAPTDPQITTTESRHIRMSQSLLFQPSSSKAPSKNSEKEVYGISIEFLKQDSVESKEDEKRLQGRPESEISRINKNLEADAKIESSLFENKKKMYPLQVRWGRGKEEECLTEEKTEWLQSEDKEKESQNDEETVKTEDEKQWMGDKIEVVNTEKDFKENEKSLDWAELEGNKNEETKPKDRSNESEKSGD